MKRIITKNRAIITLTNRGVFACDYMYVKSYLARICNQQTITIYITNYITLVNRHNARLHRIYRRTLTYLHIVL